VYRCPLIVGSSHEPEVDRRTARHELDRQQVAAIELRAVDGEGVDFLGVVGRPDVAAGRVAAGARVDVDDPALMPARFALDAQHAIPEVEHQVVAPALYDWAQHLIPALTASAAITASAIEPLTVGVSTRRTPGCRREMRRATAR
jgi:hypothetical protein